MEFIYLNIKKEPAHFNQTIELLYNEWKNIYKKSDLHTINDVAFYYKKRKDIRFFIMLSKNKVIASYSFTVREDNLYLCDVVVKPTFRQRGYSKILVNDAITRDVQEGWSEIYLNASSKLVPLYTKYGFQVLQKIDNNEYRMRKVIGERKLTLTQYFTLLIFTSIVSLP